MLGFLTLGVLPFGFLILRVLMLGFLLSEDGPVSYCRHNFYLKHILLQCLKIPNIIG